MWSVNYESEMPNLGKKCNKLVWQAESTHWYTIAKMCTFYHFIPELSSWFGKEWDAVGITTWEGGYGTAPHKIVKNWWSS